MQETISRNFENWYVVWKGFCFITKNLTLPSNICYNYFLKILYNRSFQLTNCVISGVFWTTAGSSLYRDCTSVFVRNLNRCTKNQVSSERFINVKICAENWIYSHLKNSLKENFCFYTVSFFWRTFLDSSEIVHTHSLGLLRNYALILCCGRPL